MCAAASSLLLPLQNMLRLCNAVDFSGLLSLCVQLSRRQQLLRPCRTLHAFAAAPSLLPLQNILRLCNAVDFNDFCSLCVKLMEGHPSFLQLLAKHGMSAALAIVVLTCAAALLLPLQNMLRLCNAADFNDLLSLCVKLLEDHPSILQQLQRQRPYLLVDEFQDSNKPQVREKERGVSKAMSE